MNNNATKTLISNTPANLLRNWDRYVEWCSVDTVPSIAHFAYCVANDKFELLGFPGMNK